MVKKEKLHLKKIKDIKLFLDGKKKILLIYSLTVGLVSQSGTICNAALELDWLRTWITRP